jgi:hypothetical protein
MAFVCAEVVTVGMWIYQLQKIGYPAYLVNLLWRPAIAGAIMATILYLLQDATLIWQLSGAGFSLVSYGLVLFALRTFSDEEIHQAREGIAFVSPFVASWAKKLRRDP